MVGELRSVNIIGLKCNELTALPDIVGELSPLEKVDFRGNKISTLPEGNGPISIRSF